MPKILASEQPIYSETILASIMSKTFLFYQFGYNNGEILGYEIVNFGPESETIFFESVKSTFLAHFHTAQIHFFR